MVARTGDIHPYRLDPFRPLDFRWQDACSVAAGQRARWVERGDPFVRLLARYQRSLDPESQIKVRRCEMEQLAAIQAAHGLTQRDDPLRWQVESLLLAGASDVEIAARCPLAAETIGAYQSAFFAARDAHGAYHHLVQQTVGPAVLRGFHAGELHPFWAWSALSGGVCLLDTLTDAYQATHRPDEPHGLHVYLREDSALPLALQTFVAGAVLPSYPSPFDAVCLDLQFRVLEACALQCPDAMAVARDRVAQDLVVVARAVLAGEPPPRLEALAGQCSSPRRPPNEGRLDSGVAQHEPVCAGCCKGL